MSSDGADPEARRLAAVRVARDLAGGVERLQRVLDENPSGPTQEWPQEPRRARVSDDLALGQVDPPPNLLSRLATAQLVLWHAVGAFVGACCVGVAAVGTWRYVVGG